MNASPSLLYIHNASLLTPARQVDGGALLIEDAHIVEVGSMEQVACPEGAGTLDARGLTLAPGFIDLQLNGAFGFDFTAAPETIWPAAARLPEHGVTSFLPTIITAPLETVAAAQAALQAGWPESIASGAQPLGLHLEGPFLNPAKAGAHNISFMRSPAVDLVRDWSPENGVWLVTLAPELPGALEVVRALAARGVVVSAGHSMATYEEALAGFAAGITYGTHLFNAMPPLDHRAPGLAGALLADGRVKVGLIADGVHLHPAAVALAWHASGPGHLTLVTDAMAALGMGQGWFGLGDRQVLVDATSARLADGRLAGSILTLDQAVRNLVDFTGCEPVEALRTVTETPAALLGLNDRGRVEPGCLADLVLLDDGLRVMATLVGGKIAWRNPGLFNAPTEMSFPQTPS